MVTDVGCRHQIYWLGPWRPFPLVPHSLIPQPEHTLRVLAQYWSHDQENVTYELHYGDTITRLISVNLNLQDIKTVNAQYSIKIAGLYRIYRGNISKCHAAEKAFLC